MQLLKKIVASAGVFLLAAMLLRWSLGEALVNYEMWSTAASSRTELSEDYGLGMIRLLLVDPVSVVGALIAAAATWVLPSRHNKALQPTRAAGPNEQRERAGSGPRG